MGYKVGVRSLRLANGCEGLWFDKGELAQALKVREIRSAKIAPLSWEGTLPQGEAAGEEKFACPRCRGPLERYRYQATTAILIDGCKKGCGVWVDDGEIRHISEYLTEAEKALSPAEKEYWDKKLTGAKTEQKRREELLIENLTTLDDRPGVTGLIGGVIQMLYGTLHRLGIR